MPTGLEPAQRLRRLGKRVADIAQLCALSEPTVSKVLKRSVTKEAATQETGTEIDRED
jgi:predicted transcriptional regulator